MSDKANTRLYCYRTMSKQSLTMMCAFFMCILPYAFSIFTQNPKDVINIHENKNQIHDGIILP